jgi:hypothetical protein
VKVFEVTIGVGVETWLSQPLTQDMVLLEPAPKHRKIVENIYFGNVELVLPNIGRRVHQKVYDLAFARGWPANQDKNIESVFVHSALLKSKSSVLDAQAGRSNPIHQLVLCFDECRRLVVAGCVRR